MQFLDESHLEVGKSIVIEPNEKYHENRNQTSHQRYCIKYLLISSCITKLFVTKLKSYSNEGICRPWIGIVRQSWLLRDENSSFISITFPRHETVITFNSIGRDKVAESSVKVCTGCPD